MYAGSVLVSAVDETGKNQVDTLEVGDIWYFPKGSAHTIQGELWNSMKSTPLISPGLQDENEFLLAFDDGMFPDGGFSLVSNFLQETLMQPGKSLPLLQC